MSSSAESKEGDDRPEKKSPKSPKTKESTKTKNKPKLDHLTEDYFEEDSTTSDEDDEFKPDPLEFSSSSSSEDGNEKNNSDVEMQSSDEEELLNLYDKKLRDKVSTKKKKPGGAGDDETDDRVTSRIADYMKKMRNEEKKIAAKMESGDAKITASDLAKNRRNKEAILKKFDYKMDHLKPMKGKNVLPKFDSSDSESSSSESDSDLEGLADRVSRINAGKSAAGAAKPAQARSKMPDMKKKISTARDTELAKKLAEMKKLVGNPRNAEVMDEHLMKAKQRVSDWMKEEEAKTAAIKERLNSTMKFPTEHSAQEPSRLGGLRGPRGMLDLPKGVSDMKSPLPPVKGKKSNITAGIKRDEVLSMLREDPMSKPNRPPPVDKARISVTSPIRKKAPTPRSTASGATAKIPGLTKTDSKLSSKTPAASKVPPVAAAKLPEKKAAKKPSTLKRNVAI